MTEIFSHDVSVGVAEDTEDVFFIQGKDWEGNPFRLYLRKEEAETVLWQLNFVVSEG